MSSNNNVIKEMKKIINEKSDFRVMPLPRSFANTVSTLLANIENNKKNANKSTTFNSDSTIAKSE